VRISQIELVGGEILPARGYRDGGRIGVDYSQV
jgi:hypothetical protein